MTVKPPTDLAEAYVASIQKKALDQQKVEGAEATKLIDSAQPEPPPLPPDATFSVRA